MTTELCGRFVFEKCNHVVVQNLWSPVDFVHGELDSKEKEPRNDTTLDMSF